MWQAVLLSAGQAFSFGSLPFIVTAPSSRPPNVCCPASKPKGLDRERGSFLLLLTPDNQRNHLLFCSGSGDLGKNWTFKSQANENSSLRKMRRKIYFCSLLKITHQWIVATEPQTKPGSRQHYQSHPNIARSGLPLIFLVNYGCEKNTNTLKLAAFFFSSFCCVWAKVSLWSSTCWLIQETGPCVIGTSSILGQLCFCRRKQRLSGADLKLESHSSYHQGLWNNLQLCRCAMCLTCTLYWWRFQL